MSPRSPRRDAPASPWILGGLALALALGCATRGASFETDRVPFIERGVTTQEEIRAWFGEPVSVKVERDASSWWKYLREDETRRDTGTFTKIGRSIASIFGQRVYYPPVDVAYTETVRHDLEVWFDATGVVRDYRYERTEIPSRRVY